MIAGLYLLIFVVSMVIWWKLISWLYDFYMSWPFEE